MRTATLRPAIRFMTARVFVDTNLLIYARDLKANSKRMAALAWLEALADNQSLTVN